MNQLRDELMRRFPEIASQVEGDAEFTPLMMGHLVHWLEAQVHIGFRSELVQRVVSFTKWCENQPRSKNAGEDVFTTVIISFYELLFKSRRGRRWIPLLFSREDVEKNRDYLVTWVGKRDYQKTLHGFRESAEPRTPG